MSGPREVRTGVGTRDSDPAAWPATPRLEKTPTHLSNLDHGRDSHKPQPKQVFEKRGEILSGQREILGIP